MSFVGGERRSRLAAADTTVFVKALGWKGPVVPDRLSQGHAFVEPVTRVEFESRDVQTVTEEEDDAW